MAGKPTFVDTSVIIAASVAEHPSHERAREAIDQLVRDRAPLCISPQICREILVVLTRQPVAGRTFTTEEALAVLGGWRRATNLLAENAASVDAVEHWSSVLRRGRDRQAVSTVDRPLPSPGPDGSEWIEAYRHWRGKT